jgi:hypothetical protein
VGAFCVGVKVVNLVSVDGLLTVDDHVNQILCQTGSDVPIYHQNPRVLGVFRLF